MAQRGNCARLLAVVQPSRFVVAVIALPDSSMRVKALADALQQTMAAPVAQPGVDIWAAMDAWVMAFADALAAARNRTLVDSTVQLHAAIALETVTLVMASASLSYTVRSALYDRAVVLAKPEIARLLFTATATDPVTLRRLKGLDAERPLRPRGRALSLGERKSLARTHSRDSLLLIAKDPHPSVVAIILDNPHLTEPDVVRIASARPVMAEALELIANHVRWRTRAAIKRAVVYNPYAAVATALRMMTTLAMHDVRELRDSGALSPPLQAHAELLLGLPPSAG